jgi:thiol-disulfide isomerase/thioredoxin
MITVKQLALLAVMACLTLWGCCGTLAPIEEGTVVSPALDKFTLVRLRAADGSLKELLKAEAKKAQEAGRTPYVECDATWCSSCQKLNASLGDERMIDAFEGTYIIRLDIDEWESELPDAGFYVQGVPSFFQIDEEGKPTGYNITGAAWGEDIPENMAPPLKEYFGGGSG